MTPAREDPAVNSTAALEALLRDLFPSYRSFYRFLGEISDNGLLHEVPNPESAASLAQLIHAAVTVLKASGFIDNAFFAGLVHRFPRRRRAISAVSVVWGAHPALSSSRHDLTPGSPKNPLPRRRRSLSWIVVGMVACIGAGTAIAVLMDPGAETPMPAPMPQIDDSTTSGPRIADLGEIGHTTGAGSTGGMSTGDPTTGDVKTEPPRKFVTESDFDRVVENMDFSKCAVSLMAGRPTDLTFEVFVHFKGESNPKVTVIGNSSAKAAECVAALVKARVKARFSRQWSVGPLTASATIKRASATKRAP